MNVYYIAFFVIPLLFAGLAYWFIHNTKFANPLTLTILTGVLAIIFVVARMGRKKKWLTK